MLQGVRRALLGRNRSVSRLLRDSHNLQLFQVSESRLFSGGECTQGVSQKRYFRSTAPVWSSENDKEKKETISVTYITKERETKTVQVPLGMSILEAAHENDIDLEGACEGSLACSTCHVIVEDEKYYNMLSEPSDEENDMLDLAFGLTQTSRLGCQIIAKPELDGIVLVLPAATRNFAVDGHVPKPH